MDFIYATGSALLLLLGLAGCVIPVLPGPVFSCAAILLLLPSNFAPSSGACIFFGAGCVVVLILDYVVPALGAKRFDCSRWGVIGSIVGTVVGMFFGPWGVLAGPFLGAVAGELLSGRGLFVSLRGGFGAFMGFVFGVMLKVIYSAACAGWCIYAVYDALSK